MLEKVLERIKHDNITIYYNIISLKNWYRRNNENREVVCAETRGFLTGLKQTGFITESEKRLLHSYIVL